MTQPGEFCYLCSMFVRKKKNRSGTTSMLSLTSMVVSSRQSIPLASQIIYKLESYYLTQLHGLSVTSNEFDPNLRSAVLLWQALWRGIHTIQPTEWQCVKCAYIRVKAKCDIYAGQHRSWMKISSVGRTMERHRVLGLKTTWTLRKDNAKAKES